MPTAAITTTEELNVPLNPEEVAERGVELGNVYDAILQLEAAKAAATQKIAAQIKEKKKRAAELAGAVANRAERRVVGVTEQPDYRRMAIDRIRHDTLEVIGSRPMTADEMEEARQGHLFDQPAREGGNGKARRGKAKEAAPEGASADAPPAGESAPADADSAPAADPSEPGAPGTEITPDPALLAAADAAAGELSSGHPTVRRGRKGKGLSLVKGAEDGTHHDA